MMKRFLVLPTLALGALLLFSGAVPPPPSPADTDCNLRHLLLSNDGIRECLREAKEPGWSFRVHVTHAGTCGPAYDHRRYEVTVWKSYDCPPPCLGPPDVLVLTAQLCGCHVAGYTCHNP